MVIRDIEQAISTGTPVQIAPSHLIPNRPCSEPAALQDLFGQKLQDIDAKAPKDFQISKMERRTSRKPPPDVTTSLIRAVGQSADARFLPQSNANPSGESFSAGSATFVSEFKSSRLSIPCLLISKTKQDSSPVLLSNTQNMTPSFCKPCESLQKDMDGCLYECTDVSSHNAHGLDGPRPIGQERSGPGENTIKYNAAMNEVRTISWRV